MSEEIKELEVSEENPAIFSSTYRNFSFRIDKTQYKCEKGQVKITDPEHAKLLEELIKTKPHFSSHMKKVDINAAEKLVRQHMKNFPKLNGAHQGSTDSLAIMKAQQATLLERDVALSQLSLDEKSNVLKEVSGDVDLTMTETAKQPLLAAAVSGAETK